MIRHQKRKRKSLVMIESRRTDMVWQWLGRCPVGTSKDDQIVVNLFNIMMMTMMMIIMVLSQLMMMVIM